MNEVPSGKAPQTYCFDIDGTICTNTYGNYSVAKPFATRIASVNRLFDEGHRIVYFTARGSTTGADWRSLTEAQLHLWGARYHALILGKPFADVFVDDRAVNSDDFRW